MADAGNHLPRPADVHLLDGQLALVVTHHAQEPVGVEVHRPHVPVLAPSHHHVIRHAQDGVHGVGVTRELVTVYSV